MFFAAAGKILNISIREDTKVLVLRMRSVTAIDATALHNLEQLYDSMEAKGIKMVFSHVNPQPMKAMKKAQFDKKVGEANFCEHIDEALEHAKKLASS